MAVVQGVDGKIYTLVEADEQGVQKFAKLSKPYKDLIVFSTGPASNSKAKVKKQLSALFDDIRADLSSWPAYAQSQAKRVSVVAKALLEYYRSTLTKYTGYAHTNVQDVRKFTDIVSMYDKFDVVDKYKGPGGTFVIVTSTTVSEGKPEIFTVLWLFPDTGMVVDLVK